MTFLHPLIGEQIEDYTITAEIFSSVAPQLYLGESSSHAEEAELAFIARFPDLVLSTPKKRIRVLSKAQELIDLHHPGILPFLSLGFDAQNALYMISQHKTNYTLSDYIQHRDQLIPLETSRNIIQKLAEALTYAHSHQILHGNLSPQSIYLAEQKQVFIGHFYLHLLDSTLPSPLSEISDLDRNALSLPSLYFSPERQQGDISPASDQYALACLAHVLLIGKHPVAPLHLNTGSLPPLSAQSLSELNEVFNNALAANPEQRYPDIQAFLDAFESAIAPHMLLEVLETVQPPEPIEEQTPAPEPLPSPVPVKEIPENTEPANEPPETENVPLATAPTNRLAPISERAAKLRSLILARITDKTSPAKGQKPRSSRRVTFSKSALTGVIFILLISLIIPIISTILSQQQETPAPQDDGSMIFIDDSTETETAVIVGSPVNLDPNAFFTAITMETPIYTDALAAEDPAIDWGAIQASGGGCGYLNHEYAAIVVKSETYQTCTLNNGLITNFAYQIDLTMKQDTSLAGIFFRNNYSFSVNPQGAFSVQHAGKTLISEKNDSIHTGKTESNTVAIIAQGTNLFVYLNQKFLTQIGNITETPGPLGTFAKSINFPQPTPTPTATATTAPTPTPIPLDPYPGYPYPDQTPPTYPDYPTPTPTSTPRDPQPTCTIVNGMYTCHYTTLIHAATAPEHFTLVTFHNAKVWALS